MHKDRKSCRGLKYHISGQMKVAPEHCDNKVLKIMNKPDFSNYFLFLSLLQKVNTKLKNKIYLVNYFITSHPGTSIKEAKYLAAFLKKYNMKPEQVQDFIPLPMTLATAIYYTGAHPITGESIYTPKSIEERKLFRSMVQTTNQYPYSTKETDKYARPKKSKIQKKRTPTKRNKRK